MSDPYIGEIRMVGFNFAPLNWALCNGQLLPISKYTALFSILGTTYGGDGKSNFALPNLQAFAPIGAGNGTGLTPRVLGETGGESTVTLLQTQMPMHNHGVACMTGGGSSPSPANSVWASEGSGRGDLFYANSAGTAGTMNSGVVQKAGGNLPHNNVPPFLSIYFIICMSGIYPPRG